MTSPDIPTLIHKLRNAPQLVGTFGRGDPDPLDEYRPVNDGGGAGLVDRIGRAGVARTVWGATLYLERGDDCP
jgi:hypothetical protein